MTALERAVVVGPRRQRRRRANQTGDECRFWQRDGARRFPKQMLGHRLDAVAPRAQIDAIEVDLEDLRLGELRFEHPRDRRFLRFATDGAHVRQEAAIAVMLEAQLTKTQILELYLNR